MLRKLSVLYSYDYTGERQPLRMYGDMRRKASSDTQVILNPRDFRSQAQGGYTNRNSSWELIQPSRMRRVRSRDSAVFPFRQSCCIAGQHKYLHPVQAEEESAGVASPIPVGEPCIQMSGSYTTSDVTNVDITELLDDEDLIDTTMSLRCCQDRVLKQYNRLLILAAWRPFFKENLSCPSWFLRGLNVLYALIVVALMLFFTVIQVLTCQGKLSVTDVTAQFTSDPIPSPTPEEVITPSVNVSGGTNFFAGPITPTALNEHRPPENVPPPCAHIIPTYILPAVLHFSAYIFGFYLFRIQENEQLYSLMEKVFIQARSTSGTQEKLIFNSRVYLFVSIVWISLHIGLDVLYLEAYKNDKKCSLTLCTIPAFKYIVLVIRFMGLFLVRMVSVAVVLNYGVQCEMLVMYIQGLTQRLREKTVEIRKAMHEILGLREFIGIMNSSLGMIASLCIVAFMELSILGMCLMILNKDMRVIVWAYRIMFSVLWITALVFPLVQAARVYSWGKRFRQIALEMRVFGYQTYSQLELDSFVLFVSNATLKVKLFGVTIQPATLVMTFGVAAFVLLLLIVTDVVTIAQSDYLF